MKVQDVLKMLDQDVGAWIVPVAAIVSSNIRRKPGLVTVPRKPNDDLGPGTPNSILKQAV